jgi:hypothetical protein
MAETAARTQGEIEAAISETGIHLIIHRAGARLGEARLARDGRYCQMLWTKVFSCDDLGSYSVGENDAGNDLRQQLRSFQQSPVFDGRLIQFVDHRQTRLA